MSIRRRLVALGGLTLLPVVAIQGWNEYDLRGSRETEVRETALREAVQIAAQQRRLFDGVRNVLSVLAELPEVRGLNGAGCTPLFARLRGTFEGFAALAAADATGRVFCASVANGTDEAFPPVADRAYFRRAITDNAFVVTGYAFGRRTHAPVIHLAMPFPILDGAARGVVFVALDLNWLAHELDDGKWTSDRVLNITDAAGRILVRLPGHADYVGEPLPDELWSRLSGIGVPSNLEIDSPIDGVRRVLGFLPPAVAPGGTLVGVGMSREAAFEGLDTAAMRGVAALVIGALVAALVSWTVGNRLIGRPVRELVGLTERWRAGDLSARSGMKGKGEFARLAAAYDGLADDLSRALAHKDVLLSELSHRVMNSLQTMASLFTLQARTVHDPEAKGHFEQAVGRINSVALAYRRMHKAGGSELVDFADFIRELSRDISRSLMVDETRCVVEADSLRLDPDEALSLALVVNELITNAVKHGGGAEGAVVVKLGYADEGCRLAVRNRGTLPAGFAQEASGGFGMRMVRAMVDRLGGTLSVASMGGETEFAVTFKPAGRTTPDLRMVSATA